MHKTSLKNKVFGLIMLAVVAISATSCNRGYGCPYNLKAPAVVGSVVSLIK